MRLLAGVVTFTVLSSFAVGCAGQTPPPNTNRRAEALAAWNTEHPQAATELCTWAKNHPEAASRFFDWAGHHREHSQEFVGWTLAHPNKHIDAFVTEHPRWGDFDWIAETHHPAANAFMDWVRRHPEAAEALMSHPGALVYASKSMSC